MRSSGLLSLLVLAAACSASPISPLRRQSSLLPTPPPACLALLSNSTAINSTALSNVTSDATSTNLTDTSSISNITSSGDTSNLTDTSSLSNTTSSGNTTTTCYVAASALPSLVASMNSTDMSNMTSNFNCTTMSNSNSTDASGSTGDNSGNTGSNSTSSSDNSGSNSTSSSDNSGSNSNSSGDNSTSTTDNSGSNSNDTSSNSNDASSSSTSTDSSSTSTADSSTSTDSSSTSTADSSTPTDSSSTSTADSSTPTDSSSTSTADSSTSTDSSSTSTDSTPPPPPPPPADTSSSASGSTSGSPDGNSGEFTANTNDPSGRRKRSSVGAWLRSWRPILHHAPDRRVVQSDLPAVAQNWQNLCLASGGDIFTNEPCVNLAGIDGINALLSTGGVCDQQNNADKMIDFAKSAGVTNKAELIAAAIAYRQHPRNADDIGGGIIPSTPYCTQPPRNQELVGMVNQQLPGLDPGLFGGPNEPIVAFGENGTCPQGQTPDVSTCSCA